MSPREYISKNPGCTLDDIKKNVDPKNIVSKLNALVKKGKIRKEGNTYTEIRTTQTSPTLNAPSEKEALLKLREESARREAMLLSRLEEVERKLTGRTDSLVISGSLNKEDVPINDELDTPIVFYAIGSSKIYFGYKNRLGLTVQPPYSDTVVGHRGEKKESPISFHFAFRKDGRTEKEKIQFCYYMCYSKKVLDWLRSHPLYGVEFHEQLDTIKDVDQRNQTIRSQVYSEVNSLRESEVYAQAKTRPTITIVDDIPELRKRLAEAKINERIALRDKEQVMRYNSVFENHDKSNNEAPPINIKEAVGFQTV